MKETYIFKILLIAIIFATVNASSNTVFAKVPDTTSIMTGSNGTYTSPSQKKANIYNTPGYTKRNNEENLDTIPTFVITEITIPDLSANIGDSDSHTINISGLNLSGNITIAISGTNADQFTLSQPEIIQTDSSVPNSIISFTYTPTATGTHKATLNCTSAGATDVTISLAGASGLDKPVAIAATDVSESGFIANWNTVPGASEYLLDVYFIPENPFIQDFEGFNSGTVSPAGWTFTGITGTYTNNGIYGTSSPSLRFDATGDVITTPILPKAATEMKFWLKGLASTGSSLLIEGYNDSIWIEIDNIITPSNNAQTHLYNSVTAPALPENITQFRYTYTKVTSNIALDDVSITYPGPATTPITGSPFTITGATSKEFTGLQEVTNCYYRVIAKNATITTAASNEVHVKALATNIPDTYNPLDIIASNGAIRLTANTGESVEIYNSMGQIIFHQPAKKGLNTIPLATRGLLIVKVGNRTAKVII